MNAFNLKAGLDAAHPDCAWASYVLSWLAHDLLDEPLVAGELAAGFRAVQQLDEHYWQEYWRVWVRHLHAQTIDGVMVDRIAVSLRRLQTLVGSLGPELDAEIYQWLHKA